MELTTTRVRKPAGGFCFITAEQLFAAWWCYRTKAIRLFDLRLWFALHETVARRCQKQKSRQAQFGLVEIGELVGCCDDRAVRAGVRRLATCGLAAWSEERIAFAKSATDLRAIDITEFYEAFGKVTNRKRRVPVPRRIVRMLAAGARATLIATTTGHLLRLAYYRSGECRLDGNCKASWLSDTFGIDARSVKTARARLVELGWLVPDDIPQWYLNRYGWRGSVNPQWSELAVVKRSPPKPQLSIKRSPLRENKKLSTRPCTNQKPTKRDPSGFWKKRWLTNVKAKDLESERGRRALFVRAVRSGILSDDGACYRYFVAAAERTRRLATRNPAGMFAWLVSNRRWHHLSDADHDSAKTCTDDGRGAHGPPVTLPNTGGLKPVQETPSRTALARAGDVLPSIVVGDFSAGAKSATEICARQ